MLAVAPPESCLHCGGRLKRGGDPYYCSPTCVKLEIKEQEEWLSKRNKSRV
jgi:hypothetical protein